MKKVALPLCLSLGLLCSGATIASNNINDDLSIVKTGTLVCGKGDIRMRNLNTGLRLFTVRIELYDRNGTLVYDSSVNGFPSDYRRTLPPQASTQLNEASMMDLVTTAYAGGPWQTWFYFKNIGLTDYTAVHGLPPKAGGVKKHTNDTGAVLGYHSFSCNFQAANR